MKLSSLLTFLLCLSIGVQTVGQNKKKALQLMEQGNEYLFEKDYPQFQPALEKFLEAHQIYPDTADLNFKIGVCYLNLANKTEAIPYLETAIQQNSEVNEDVYFLMASAYHYDMQFDKAIQYYKKYKKQRNPLELKKRKQVLRILARVFREDRRYRRNKYVNISGLLGIIKTRIKECKKGKELVNNPTPYEITNLSEDVNSPYPEYAPVISADESRLIFTSRRPNSTGGRVYKRDGKHYEDVYQSVKTDTGWSQPTNDLGGKINSKAHESAIGLSADGQTMFLFRNKGDGGDIYESKLQGSEWSKPKRMPPPINSQFAEKSASLAPGGQKIYFVSVRRGTYAGSQDILMAEKKENGEWGEAQNLGGTVNTNFDEAGVFIHPDGKTLYFSSKGHSSMGGYDVFKTMKTDTGWSEPENMGYPINTPDNDVFFVMSASGKRAYFSTIRDDGLGDQDIYTISWKKDTAKGVEAKKSKMLTVVKGIIEDQQEDEPLQANIKVVDNKTNETVAELTSNSETGKYLITLPAGKNYGITISKDGYLFHSKNFNIPDSQAYKEITMDLALQKAQEGAKITLENIFFDYDKAELREESKPELDRLAKFLKKSPKMKVEISGHTDSKGDKAYNQKLSEQRARSVVDYLVEKHGIKRNRLKAVGYGETKPTAPNIMPDGSDNPDGRQFNRRTELEILDEEGEKVASTKQQGEAKGVISIEEAETNEHGVLFTVQVASSSKSVPGRFFRPFDVVYKQSTAERVTKYMVGNFSDYSEAEAYKRELHRQGLKDAFVVAVKNGQRIEVDKAKQLTKQASN